MKTGPAEKTLLCHNCVLLCVRGVVCYAEKLEQVYTSFYEVALKIPFVSLAQILIQFV